MSGGGSAPSIPQYSNFGAADQGSISGTQALANAGNTTSNLFNQVLPSYAGNFQGTSYTPQQGVYAGQNLTNSVSGLPGYANQALSTGFNANNGLYTQELQQVQDQARAGQAARGIASTPYGAGLEDQAVLNFNNQWQQQQLQNQQTAAGTADSLLGQYGAGIGGGQQLAQGAAQGGVQTLAQMLQAAGYSTAQTQQAIQDYLSYLSGGTQAASSQAQATNQANANNNSAFSGFGNLAGGLIGLFA